MHPQHHDPDALFGYLHQAQLHGTNREPREDVGTLSVQDVGLLKVLHRLEQLGSFKQQQQQQQQQQQEEEEEEEEEVSYILSTVRLWMSNHTNLMMG